MYVTLRVTHFLLISLANVLTITRSCLVDSSVSVQWMVSTIHSQYTMYTTLFYPFASLPPVVTVCVLKFKITHL